MAKRRLPDDTPKLSVEESKKQLWFLLQFFRPAAGKIVIALFFLLLSSGVGLIFPAFLGKLVDVVLYGEQTGVAMETVIAGLVLVLLVQAVMRYYTSLTLARVTETTLASLRVTLFERLLRLPMTFYAERRVGELASRLSSDLSLVQETFTFSIIEMLRQTLFFMGSVFLIAARSLQLTGVIVVTLPVIVGIALFFAKFIRRYSTKTQDALADAAIIVEESLQAITGVKVYTNENYETQRYANTMSGMVLLAIKGAKIRSAFISFVLFSLFAGIAGVIWYGGSLVRSGAMSMGDLTSFIIYATFVAGALGSFAELFAQVQRTLGASVRLQEILQTEPENVAITPVPPLSTVQFQNIHFAYPSRPELPVLKNISLSLDDGKRYAFVGESGAGKSTCASLIQRLYEPQSGEILMNGRNINDQSLYAIRSNIGVVPQDIVLFGGSINDNIRYGNRNATDEEVWQAATLANADEFITSFPDTIHTIVGERGMKLSGGQRQRIAIARAILKNPPILILDEATSSLDSQTELLIQEAMERLMKGRTTIIIAHRLSTIRTCDTIFVFSKGEIVERGTHEELLRNPTGLYAKLCALQFGLESE